MERTLIPSFETPSFSKRLKSMLGVDFYRLFHTPLFYIMVAISAIIPAMVLSMGTMDICTAYLIQFERCVGPESLENQGFFMVVVSS